MARVFYSLARREVGLHASSAVFRLIVALTVLLSIVTVSVGIGEYRDRQAQFVAERNRVDAARFKPHNWLMGWSTEPSLRAVRAPSPASILVRGLDATRPDVWDFSPAGVLEGRLSQSGPEGFETGSPIDLEWLMRLMIGFLALWMGVESLGGERVRGHLRAVAVQPVGAATVFVAKTAGAAISLAAAVLIVLAAADAVLFARGAAAFWPDRSGFLAAFGAASLAYGLAMFGVGALVGGLVRQYAAMSAGVIAAWVLLALVGPQLATGAAALFASVEPRARLEQDREQVFAARETASENRLGLAFLQMGATLADVRSAVIPEAIRRRMATLWAAEADETRRVMSAMTGAYRTAARRRRQLQIALSRIDPAAVFLETACNLAGTGRASAARWSDGAEAYQRSLEVRLFDNRPRLTVRVPTARMSSIVSIIRYDPPLTPASIPGLSLTPAMLLQRLRDAMSDSLVLAGYALAFLMGAFVVFRNRALGRRYADSSSAVAPDDRP